MKRLTLYVAGTVMYTSFIMILALSSIFIIFTYISQAKDIGTGHYSALSAFLYVLYQTPYNIYLIMPICALLGGMMGLGLLANNSELIVMRAAGQSIFQISKGVFVTGVILGVLTFILGAYIAPHTQQRADLLKTIATGGNESLVLYDTKSIWSKVGDEFINVGENIPGKPLQNISKYKIVNNQLVSFATAESAVYQNNEWHVHNVRSTQLNADGAIIETQQTSVWPQLMPPKVINILSSDTNYLNINQIIEYIRLNQDDTTSTNRISLKLWQIIFQPVALIILMLVAVPFSLGSTRSSAVGLKFVAGVVLGFSYYIINQTFGPLTLVYQLPPFLGAAIPSMIYAMILAVLFVKMKE